MSKVFVVQDTKWVDPKDGTLKPKFDFSPAAEFGELVFLLGSNASPFNLPPVLSELQERLKDFGDDDYLLLVGNPVLLGLATAIAADFNDGSINMLQWSGAKRTYISVKANGVFADCQDEAA